MVENPVINRVAFEGNKKAKDEQLSSEVQSKARGTFSRATVQSDVQRIIEVYQRNGRYDVRVDPKIIELPNGRVDLVFEINEGAKTGVAKIIFVGNKRFSDYRLKDVIKTGETNWLSFLKSNDIYDPDRIEVDRDLLRRFYLKNGFADVRIVSATGEYDPEQKGFIITFTIDEGEQYHFGAVNIQSSVPAVPRENRCATCCASNPATSTTPTRSRNPSKMSTIEVAKRGYPFAAVRPRGDRNSENRTVNVTFVVEEGPHTYIERINIKGNTRTRDYVIRREFDIVEGDAYNRALVDRAERRIKNLGYFKNVKITTEPGSAPDRIIINCDVEEQSTGEFSFAGGYSTSDGVIGEVSVGERNLLGTRPDRRRSRSNTASARAASTCRSSSPISSTTASRSASTCSPSRPRRASYLSYLSTTVGGDIKLGIPITENISTQLRYTAYQQSISLPHDMEQLQRHQSGLRQHLPDARSTGNFKPNRSRFRTIRQRRRRPTATRTAKPRSRCARNWRRGRCSCRRSAIRSPTTRSTTTSSPTNGMLVEFKQDVAGAGGDVKFVKSTIDARLYNEVFPDIVGMLRLQGGYRHRLGRRRAAHARPLPGRARTWCAASRRPASDRATLRSCRTATARPTRSAARSIGRRSLEFQTPMPFAPKDFGMKLALFADAGQLSRYVGPTSWLPPSRARPARRSTVGDHEQAALVGRRRPDLGFAVRAAAVRSRLCAHQGTLRQDAVLPVRRRNQLLTSSCERRFDRTHMRWSRASRRRWRSDLA